MKIWRKRASISINQSINYKGVCRTAPAIPGLLNISLDELKEAMAVHLNFLLLVFSLYRTFKSGIVATGEHIP